MDGNLTTSTPNESSRHFLELPDGKAQRRLVYDITQGLEGGVIFWFNLFLLVCYYLSVRAGKKRFSNRFSYGLLSLISFCMFHGIVFSVVVTLQRNFRRTLSDSACVFTTLLIDFCDIFILVLLPLNAIERLIQLHYSTFSKRKHRAIMTVIFISLIVVAALLAWLPSIPGFSVEHDSYQAADAAGQQRVKSFRIAYSCGGRTNKRSKVIPYLHLTIQLVCAALVILLHAIIHNKTKVYQALPQASDREKRRMGIVSRSALAMSIVVIITNVPFSISEVLRAQCKSMTSDAVQAHACSAWTLELRFIIRIIYHSGNFLAPLIYCLLDPRIRRGLRDYLTCGKKRTIQPRVQSNNNSEGRRTEHNSFIHSKDRLVDLEMSNMRLMVESV